MKKNSNGEKVNKTVKFTENKYFEPQVVFDEAREVAREQRSKPEDLSEAMKESFNAKLNEQIGGILGVLAQLDLAYPQEEVCDALIELCGAVQINENCEIKERLVQFWGVVPKDNNLFRKAKWQKVNTSLGSSKLTAQDYFADLSQQINQDEDRSLKEILGQYVSSLESYDGKVFDQNLEIHQSKINILKEIIQTLEKELETDASQSDHVSRKPNKIFQFGLANKRKDLTRAEIEKHIFILTPKEEELSRNLSAIKADYQEQRVEIAAKIAEESTSHPENLKQLGWRLKIVNAEEEIELIKFSNLKLPCDNYLVGLIKSDPEIKSQYQGQLQKELEKEWSTKVRLPALKNELSHLKFIEKNYYRGRKLNSWIEGFLADAEAREELEEQKGNDKLEPEWRRVARIKTLNAKNNLCCGITVYGDNEMKIELIEHLRRGGDHCEDSFKNAVNQCQNLEVRQALLDYEIAAAELEDITLEQKKGSPEFESAERKKQIRILALKSSIIAKEIEVMEVNVSPLKEIAQEALDSERQLLIEEEEALTDLQIENFITQADQKRFALLDVAAYEDSVEKQFLEIKWRRQEIEYWESSLEGEAKPGSAEQLQAMKFQLKAEEAKLKAFDNEDEIKSVALTIQMNEEILGFDKVTSYPLAGRRLSENLLQRSKDNSLLADRLRDLELDRCILKLTSDLELCEQHDRQHPHIKELNIKMALCDSIRECDGAAKDLAIEYLQESNSFEMLPDAAFEFKNPNISKIFADFGLAIVEHNHEVISGRVASQAMSADRDNELTKNILVKMKAVLDVRNEIIAAEIANLEDENLNEELKSAQINLTKAWVEMHIYSGEKSWKAHQAEIEITHEQEIFSILAAIGEYSEIVAAANDSQEDETKLAAEREIRLLEIKQKIAGNIFQQAVIDAKADTYNHELVALITSLPRSETQYDEVLQEEMDKISPQTKSPLLDEHESLLEELRQAKNSSEDWWSLTAQYDVSENFEEDNFDSENINPKSPNNSPEKAKVVTDALMEQKFLGGNSV